MKIQILSRYPYEIPLTNGNKRSGMLIKISGDEGKCGYGDIAPLPNWSQETLDQAMGQLSQKMPHILKIDWTARTYIENLKALNLLPSVQFGLESALVRILFTTEVSSVLTSALLMGTKEQILEDAKKRKLEGYQSAKFKLPENLEEAREIVYALKDTFRLRIDCNRKLETEEALQFFKEFDYDAFDYVEEPFKNPKDLHLFTHPLAVDESYPFDLTLEDLKNLPTLKAIVYKPTIQGGELNCLPLIEFAKERNIQVVLSSSFESDIGLINIASMAHRLSLTAPIGIGTYHYLTECIHGKSLFSNNIIHIPLEIRPKMKFLNS